MYLCRIHSFGCIVFRCVDISQSINSYQFYCWQAICFFEYFSIFLVKACMHFCCVCVQDSNCWVTEYTHADSARFPTWLYLLVTPHCQTKPRLLHTLTVTCIFHPVLGLSISSKKRLPQSSHSKLCKDPNLCIKYSKPSSQLFCLVRFLFVFVLFMLFEK